MLRIIGRIAASRIARAGRSINDPGTAGCHRLLLFAATLKVDVEFLRSCRDFFFCSWVIFFEITERGDDI